MSEWLKLSDLESDEGTQMVSSVGSNPTYQTKRVVTKVLSTGALEASVSRFDSCLLD